MNQTMREAAEPRDNGVTGFEVSHSWGNSMAEHSVTPNDERSVLHRTGEGDRAVEQVDHVRDPWTGPWHSPILPRNHRLDGRGNGSARAQHILAMQHTYGNRAVQRQVENSSMESIFEQWAATGRMGETLGQAVDSRQNQAHDEALDSARSAITGKQPEWPTKTYPPYVPVPIPVPLHEITYPGEGVPQYTEVSPTLNFYEFLEQMRESDMKGGR